MFDLSICELSPRRSRRGRLHDTQPIGVLFGIGREDILDGSPKGRPVKVAGGIGKIHFGVVSVSQTTEFNEISWLEKMWENLV